MYGREFERAYPDTTLVEAGKDSWARALGGLTFGDIRAGLARLKADGKRFVPTAPEFRALCKAAKVPTEKALPRRPSSDDVARSERARLLMLDLLKRDDVTWLTREECWRSARIPGQSWDMVVQKNTHLADIIRERLGR